ncbi:MAG: AsmA family protein, partial [Planctomycetota bacterium]
MSDSQPSPIQRKRGPGRGRRLLRIGLWSIGALCLVIGLSLWLVTRSWFMVWQLGPQLERRLGGDVQVGSAVYERGGTLVFRDVILRSRAHSGPAGEVLRVGRMVVRVDLYELVSGDLRLEQVRLEHVVIRASEDANEPGVFSFMALEPDWSMHEDIDQLVLPPQVQIRDAVLELGLHDGARYEARGRQRVTGQMSPAYENDPWYNLVLSEIDERGNRRGSEGLLISGRWNVATNQYTMRVDGLALDDETYQMCPQLALLWWDRMDLEGRVSAARLEWKPGQPYTVEFAVENVGLTLPIETEGLWAQYRFGQIVPASGRPRMLVSSGTIRLEGDRLTLENLIGDLVSVDASQQVGGEPGAA